MASLRKITLYNTELSPYSYVSVKGFVSEKKGLFWGVN
jgi:hypothetical protein